MTRKRQWMILGGLGAMYFIGLGALVGITNERFQFAAVRSGILRDLEEAAQRLRRDAMAREYDVQRSAAAAASPATAPTAPVTWDRHLEAMDAALQVRNVAAADRAWREAYAAALRTRAWRPLVDIGDAALRIGAVDLHRQLYVSRARELYVGALVRARADRSVEGVLHVAESFQALGDHGIVDQCLIIAEGLGARRDHETVSRLRAVMPRVVELRAMPRLEP